MGGSPCTRHVAPIRDVGSAKGDVELKGDFAIGEGIYRVEALLEDEAHRACYSQWSAEAILAGDEKTLQPGIPAGAVREVGGPTSTRYSLEAIASPFWCTLRH